MSARAAHDDSPFTSRGGIHDPVRTEAPETGSIKTTARPDPFLKLLDEIGSETKATTDAAIRHALTEVLAGVRVVAKAPFTK
jgi:hypothetical protein